MTETTSGGESDTRETRSEPQSLTVSAEGAPSPPPAPEPSMDSGGDYDRPARASSGMMESIFGGGDEESDNDADRRIAQAEPPRQRPPEVQPSQPQQQNRPPQTATDATTGPLLIYEATLNLAVYQVQDNQRAVIAVAQELGGFLAQQNDQVVIIRIPAGKFQEALGRIEALGDVLHRNVQAQDVSEQFRDLQIRLRNAEQIRDRLASLLQQARNVEESLSIERELERITTDIETMKGRLRFLQDRIGFSTITVNFQPREQENLQGEIFHLPFEWLYNLGLRTLLNLR